MARPFPWSILDRRAVLDTGPLFSALTLQYLRAVKASDSHRKSVLHKNQVSNHLQTDRAKQSDFLVFVEAIEAILTTSHVIGEIQGLQCLKNAAQRDFWQSSMKFLRTKKLDERLLTLLDLFSNTDHQYDYGELVCTIGPTDVGLIRLAYEERCVLLTDDARTLAPRARGMGVRCLLLQDLVQ
jgi:hypothetical protein